MSIRSSLLVAAVLISLNAHADYVVQVGSGTVPAGNYDITYMGSNDMYIDYFLALVGTFTNYVVDMPTGNDPYVLGDPDSDPTVDFGSRAEVDDNNGAHYRDGVTGDYFDYIRVRTRTGNDPGGAYALKYSYSEHLIGVSGGYPKTTTTIILVNADPLEKGNGNSCQGRASVEHNPFARDLALTPQAYIGQPNDIPYDRGAYVPWQAVTTIQDMINKTNAQFTTQGSKVTIVLLAHGWTDYWATNLAVELHANDPNVQAYGAGVIGHVSKVYTESCCTAKGFTDGAQPNVIESLSDAVTASGDTYAEVCGWNQFTYSWFRNQGFHVGHSKGDTLTCGHPAGK